MVPVVSVDETGAEADDDAHDDDDDDDEGADVVDEGEESDKEDGDDGQPPYSLADFGAMRLPIYNGMPMLNNQQDFQLPFDIWAKVRGGGVGADGLCRCPYSLHHSLPSTR